MEQGALKAAEWQRSQGAFALMTEQKVTLHDI